MLKRRRCVNSTILLVGSHGSVYCSYITVWLPHAGPGKVSSTIPRSKLWYAHRTYPSLLVDHEEWLIKICSGPKFELEEERRLSSEIRLRAFLHLVSLTYKFEDNLKALCFSIRKSKHLFYFQVGCCFLL